MPDSRILQHPYFNPRSREGSDHGRKRAFPDLHVFQSTLPRGERLFNKLRSAVVADFNPRSREGSDEEQMEYLREWSEFQSTLPRGERREADQHPERDYAISIHAPARGATIKKQRNSTILQFQSTLPRGERRIHGKALANFKIFQSTLPRGERLLPRPVHLSVVKFQSTLPRGERLVAGFQCCILILFQSTLPRGERPQTIAQVAEPTGISIHAPARGATVDGEYADNIKDIISIHAPARGATM